MRNKHKLEMVSIRLVKEKNLLSDQPINSPEAAIKILGEEIKQYDREVAVIINLQSDCKPINASIVSIGSINASLVVPRDVMKSSILSNAASVIMLHNHRRKSMLTSGFYYVILGNT